MQLHFPEAAELLCVEVFKGRATIAKVAELAEKRGLRMVSERIPDSSRYWFPDWEVVLLWWLQGTLLNAGWSGCGLARPPVMRCAVVGPLMDTFFEAEAGVWYTLVDGLGEFKPLVHAQIKYARDWRKFHSAVKVQVVEKFARFEWSTRAKTWNFGGRRLR